MDLADWKNAEVNATQAIEQAKVGIELNQIILTKAIVEIKKLGGTTLREEQKQKQKEADEAKKEAEKQQKNTTSS